MISHPKDKHKVDGRTWKKRNASFLHQQMALWLPPQKWDRVGWKHFPNHFIAFMHYTFQKFIMSYGNLPGNSSFNTSLTQWISIMYFPLCKVPKSHLCNRISHSFYCCPSQGYGNSEPYSRRVSTQSFIPKTTWTTQIIELKQYVPKVCHYQFLLANRKSFPLCMTERL